MQKDWSADQPNQLRRKYQPIETNIEIITSDIGIQQTIKADESIDIQKHAIFDPDQKVLIDL